MPQPTEYSHATAAVMAEALAADLAARLGDAVATRGHAVAMVSGGRTPQALFAALARRPVDWARVSVGLVDERWVPVDHVDSNERLVREGLLALGAGRAGFVGMKNDAATPQEGESACEAALAGLAWPVDVVVLGMGDDGHTASFFPAASALARALDLTRTARCCAIDPPVAPHARMTLTLRALLDSRRIVLMISGHDKWSVYRSALEPGAIEAMPIRAVLAQTEVPVDVHWAP